MNISIDIESTIHWLVSIAGLACSIAALYRDKKNAKFSASVMQEVTINTGINMIKGGWYLRFEVVNVGRRPLVLTDFLGSVDSEDEFKNISFMDANKVLHQAGKNGYLLSESEKFTVTLPIQKIKPGTDWNKVKSLWVEDSHGDKYFLAKSDLDKLKKSIKEVLAE